MKSMLAGAAFLGLSLLPGSTEAEAPKPPYIYYAQVNHVISGDTVAMDIDLGLSVWVHNQPLHLKGVTAPDPSGPEKEKALKWKQRLGELLKDRSEIVVQTTRDKSVNPPRYQAVIWADGENINDAMNAAQ